jgi:subtilisin family serine protease
MCDISLGRLEPCKTSVGGLKAVYIMNNGDATNVTYDATETDAITAIAGTPTGYKYDLKGNSSFEQTINSSRENGTTFFTQTLNLTLKGITAKDLKQIKLLAYGRPQIIVEDNNGKFFYTGLKNGMEVTGGTIVSGAAMGDLSGFTLTIVGEEPVPANIILTSLTTAGVTIVVGT